MKIKIFEEYNPEEESKKNWVLTVYNSGLEIILHEIFYRLTDDEADRKAKSVMVDYKRNYKDWSMMEASFWDDVRANQKFNSLNEAHHKNLEYYIEQKKRAEERKEKAKMEIDAIEISDEEIKNILVSIKSKEYNVIGNIDKVKKLQNLRLIKEPNAIQTVSSFSFPFYLTDKGLKLISDK